jgi:hypothetical protein
MNWPKLKCPFCGNILPNREVKPGSPLVCPSCSQKLQFAGGQLRLSVFVAIGLSIGMCFLLGLRDLWFLLATVLFWFPMLLIWEFIFVRIVPPKFELYDPEGRRSNKYRD